MRRPLLGLRRTQTVNRINLIDSTFFRIDLAFLRRLAVPNFRPVCCLRSARPFRDSTETRCLLARHRSGPLTRFLSWGSSKTTLPSTYSPGVHSQNSKLFLRPSTATPTTCSARVVLHNFSGLLHLGAVGLLHPTTNHRVRQVSMQQCCHHCASSMAHTLRSFSLVYGWTVSPRSIPSRLFADTTLARMCRLRPQGFDPHPSPLSPQTLPS